MRAMIVAVLSAVLMLGCSPAVEDFTEIRGAVKELKTPLAETGKLDGFCSGVLVSETFMLTAAHCDIGQPIFVNGYRAFVVKKDDERDLMALHIPHGAHCPCVPNLKVVPERDAKVYSVGFPLDAGQVLTEGRWQGEDKKGDMLFTSPITNGNSGGGVFLQTKNGWALVGIVSRGTIIPLGGFVPAIIGHLNYGPGGTSIFEFITGE